MPRKKRKSEVPEGSGEVGSSSNLPVLYRSGESFLEELTGEGIEDLSSIPQSRLQEILGNPNLTKAEKKRALLREMGRRGTRKKYESPTARKEAAKERSKTKRDADKEALAELGFLTASKTKYTGMSEEEAYKAQREVSKARGSKKRNFLRQLTQTLPRTARTFGLRPEGVREEMQMSPQEKVALREYILAELRELL